MRIIAIKEKDIKILMERLELKKFQLSEQRPAVDEMHRHFHYIVASWFQKQGSTWPHE